MDGPVCLWELLFRAAVQDRVEEMASQAVVAALQQLEQQLAGLERGKATDEVVCDSSEQLGNVTVNCPGWEHCGVCVERG